MRITTHTDPRRFAELARPWLLLNEARHCLVLGILDALVSRPERCASSQLLSIEGPSGLEGVAWRTPPHPLGLSSMTPAAVSALVDHLAASAVREGVPAVVGARPEVDQFKARWLQRTPASLSRCIEQRLYQLEVVLPSERAPGRMRTATPRDAGVVLPWSAAFLRECGLGEEDEELRRAVAGALATGQRMLWELEGEAVAMAGFQGKTPSGVRISWVYTPPEWRSSGYASALVATLSERLLAAGNRVCFLYTDLGNSTSNGIYQRIGYRPVCDAAHYMFSP